MTGMLLVIYMAVCSRAAGGGFGAHILNKRGAVGDDGRDLGGRMPFNLTWLPEALFAMPFAYLWFTFSWWGVLCFLIAGIWTYAFMQSATAPALHWGNDPYASVRRHSTLSPIVNMLARAFKISIGSTDYCRLYMAVKGFLIGLPAGGVVLAVLWPLGYEIGDRFDGFISFDPQAIKEGAAGAGAAIAIIIWISVFH